MKTTHIHFLLSLLTLIAAAGCSGEKDQAALNKDADASKNLDAIHVAYEAALEKNRRPPKSREDLINFLPEEVDKSSVFRSPRDQQDFVIVWEADLKTLQQQAEPVVIAYEKKGVDGERHVLTSMGLLTMTDNEFEKAKFAQGHKP